MMRSTKIWATVGLLCLFGFANGQTYNRIYQLLQSRCASCHGGANPTAFDLGTTPAATYAALVGVTPLNPAAASKGYKRIDPGHPYNSFLLKKVGANLDGTFHLETGEGNPMPNQATSLSAYEAELIRQWIQAGAQQTGNVVDTALVLDYYTNGGQPFKPAPAAPAPGTGFQIRFGPIFVPTAGNSGSEVEYLKKEQMKFADNMEVTSISGDLDTMSHHFLLFMFDDSASAASYPQGMRVVSLFNTATDGNKALQGAWQYDHTMNLPSGTAFYYDKRDVLDLNYHIKNYSSTEILAADLYLNVYTQPRGSGAKEMRAQLVNNGGIIILPGIDNEVMEDTWGGDDRDIWIISSHTHKYGKDFDIFVRDSVTHQAGPQIYEGYFNRDYTFNQGYYDWEHPAIREFDSTLYTVRASEGLIFKTTYNNTSGNIIFFGLTTNDEMQLSTYLYVNTHEVVVGNAPQTIVDPYRFTVYPNPMRDHTTIDFGGVVRSGAWSIVDVDGKQVSAGSFRSKSEVQVEQQGLAGGVYLLNITLDNGKAFSRKLLVR